MGFGVDGYLEIYTTMYGWMFYGFLWDILSQTGIILLPVLGLLVKNWMDSAESADQTSSAQNSTRLNIITLPLLLFVFLIGAVPIVNVQPSQVYYKDVCTNTDVSGADTGTTYDRSFSHIVNHDSSRPIKSPIFWMLVTQVGSGINSFVKGKIPCSNNLRARYNDLRTASISDPMTQEHAKRFTQECFLRARDKFHDKRYQHYVSKKAQEFKKRLADEYDDIFTSPEEAMRKAEKAFQEDINSAYSEFYGQTPGFYEECNSAECGNFGLSATAPVDGWAYDSTRDGYSPFERDLAAQRKLAGTPTCKEWWYGPRLNPDAKVQLQRGAGEPNRSTTRFLSLQQQIGLEAFGKDAEDVIHDTRAQANRIRSFYMSAVARVPIIPGVTRAATPEEIEKTKKDLVRNVMNNTASNANWVGGNGYNDGDKKSYLIMAAQIKDLVNKGLNVKLSMFFVKEAAPVVKAFLLMGIYALLLVYMILSGYSLKSLIPATALIISIQFWPALWEFAKFLDDNMFAALFPQGGTLGGEGGIGVQRSIFALLTLALFVLFPLLLSFILTLSGVSASRAMQSVSDSMTSPTSNLTNGNKNKVPKKPKGKK